STTSCRSSQTSTLTMSSTKVCRSTWSFSKWLRSPRPVSVGVWTVCPAARKRPATRDQHQPPCQAPCTSTKVSLLFGKVVTADSLESERGFRSGRLRCRCRVRIAIGHQQPRAAQDQAYGGQDQRKIKIGTEPGV